jgi:putative aldouronate transport system permease protein
VVGGADMKRRKITFSYVLIVAFLLFFSLLCLLPFWYVLISSLSDPLLLKTGDVRLIPNGFSLQAYKIVLGEVKFYRGFLVSISRTLLGTSLGLGVQAMTAYVLSRKYFQARKLCISLVVFTILFNGGIIPNYLVIKKLNLLDTIWSLVFPMAFNPWNVLLLISFFAAIPDSIEESAKLDGANDFTIFSRLAVPLSRPALMTIMLFISVRHWNELMDGVIYINSDILKPLQVYLIELIMRSSVQNMVEPMENYVTVLSIQTTAIFVSCLPILMLYPIVQKHFVKGIMIGGVKG